MSLGIRRGLAWSALRGGGWVVLGRFERGLACPSSVVGRGLGLECLDPLASLTSTAACSSLHTGLECLYTSLACWSLAALGGTWRVSTRWLEVGVPTFQGFFALHVFMVSAGIGRKGGGFGGVVVALAVDLGTFF